MVGPGIAPVIGRRREPEQLGAAAPAQTLHRGAVRDLVAITQEQEASAPGIRKTLQQPVPHRPGLRAPEGIGPRVPGIFRQGAFQMQDHDREFAARGDERRLQEPPAQAS